MQKQKLKNNKLYLQQAFWLALVIVLSWAVIAVQADEKNSSTQAAKPVSGSMLKQ